MNITNHIAILSTLGICSKANVQKGNFNINAPEDRQFNLVFKWCLTGRCTLHIRVKYELGKSIVGLWQIYKNEWAILSTSWDPFVSQNPERQADICWSIVFKIMMHNYCSFTFVQYEVSIIDCRVKRWGKNEWSMLYISILTPFIRYCPEKQPDYFASKIVF